MDVDSQTLEDGDTQTHNPEKRLATEMDAENEEDLVDRLLPAAAAMKRRRIEEQEEAVRTGKPIPRSSGQPQKELEAEKPKKLKKEINIKDVVRERREAEEDAARREEEDLRYTVDGIDVEGLRNLAVVEEMELTDRAKQLQRNASDDTSTRWDERWNGRKNFKKFHRQGEGTQARRGQTVIVPLEEVKKRDFGIGENYWQDDDKSKKRRKVKERASQSESQPYTTAQTALDEDVMELEGEDTPARADAEVLQQSANRFRLANGKRPAPDRGRGPAAKKQKTFTVKDSDSESEDELKFRFKKRR